MPYAVIPNPVRDLLFVVCLMQTPRFARDNKQ
jgi:hypothetical protein